MVLELREISKEFGKLSAVDDVDLTLEDGEFRSLIGPNGAGKTTLFNLVSGILEPTDGQILHRGDDITDFSPQERAKRGLARSFQIINLFPEFTVAENVRVPLHHQHGSWKNWWSNVDHIEPLNEEVESILEYMNIGVDPDEKVAEISHGEKRQLELAVAVACDPEILLLDEPTAGLSHSEIDSLRESLSKLRKDYTIFLVEHNINLVMDLSDMISVLSRGSILAEGTPSQIQQNRDVQSAYLGGEVA